jgi:hypothetical protein
LIDDIVAMIVLRHYNVPSRILDWSRSPWVAAYFATKGHDDENGEIWTFDEPMYERKGVKQWIRWPETTFDGSGKSDKFKPELTAFALDSPPDWFICQFYGQGFHRHNAQQSAYSMTARFGCNHAESIAKLLEDPKHFRRFVIGASLKPRLREMLREEHGIWRGSLNPDSAGAAETARDLFLKGDHEH